MRCGSVALSLVGVGLLGCPASHVADGAGLDATLDGATHDAGAPDARPLDAPRFDAPDARCVLSCTRHEECASSCPASSIGPSCCDRPSGVCYATSAPTCPDLSLDAGSCEAIECTTDGDCEPCWFITGGLAASCCDLRTGHCRLGWIGSECSLERDAGPD